jgi:hypothetical protein
LTVERLLGREHLRKLDAAGWSFCCRFFFLCGGGKGKDDSKFLMMMMMMRGIHTDATPYLKAERHTRGQSKTTTTTLSR